MRTKLTLAGVLIKSAERSLKTIKEMAEVRVKRKHFDNPYPDYNSEVPKSLLNGEKINECYKIVQHLDEKWKSTTEKISRHLKYTDNTVYTGTAGIALLYLKKDCNDADYLRLAQNMAVSNKIQSKRRLTFLTGDAGPLAIGAVISHRLQHTDAAKGLIKQLIALKTDAVNYKAECADEYLYGRAGYLFALLYVNKHVCPPLIDDDLIKSVIEAIIKSGLKLSKTIQSNSPLMYKWHDSYYLGAAHGLTGILYLLLQVPEYLNATQMDLIKGTIDYLATLQFRSGNYPSSLESQSGDKYVQWCHGAPGFLYMFSQAYKVYKDHNYLELALKCGEVVWQRGLLKKGYSICHGVSGNAYCFLELYQTTNDEKHLYRAVKFAEWCLDCTKSHEEYSPDRPLSLYEGIAGPMYLLLDIQVPKQAKFPGFTL